VWVWSLRQQPTLVVTSATMVATKSTRCASPVTAAHTRATHHRRGNHALCHIRVCWKRKGSRASSTGHRHSIAQQLTHCKSAHNLHRHAPPARPQRDGGSLDQTHASLTEDEAKFGDRRRRKSSRLKRQGLPRRSGLAGHRFSLYPRLPCPPTPTPHSPGTWQRGGPGCDRATVSMI
jgi:hypothetical protein